MQYREEKEVTKQYKQNYVDGITRLIEKRQAEKVIRRADYAAHIFERQDAAREEFRAYLGWPLTDCPREGLPVCHSELLAHEDGYTIYRMQFEIFDGLLMSGMFFQAGEEKKPLVLLQHGGMGSPELISGVYGTTSNYNDMLHRVRKHDVHVFAPQLLLWEAAYEVPFDRREADAKLKQTGGSITALEIFGLQRILDYFEAQTYTTTFGMVGLSYGGFYTLFTAALDERIKSSISCSFFNQRSRIGWPDWNWTGMAEKFDDAEIACLVYPRKICLQMGKNDELFDSKYSRESFETIKKLAAEVGTDWVDFVLFDGIHEFCMDDEPIEKLICDLKEWEKLL